MRTGAPTGVTRELERERERAQRLLQAVASLAEEQRRLEAELGHATDQVTYYDSLARDMKRELRRPGLSAIIRSLQR